MRYRTLRVITPPTIEPVSLAEAKQHLRIEHDADDSLISASITAAREWTEVYLDSSLIATRWRVTLDMFPAEIVLPKSPLLSSPAPVVTYKTTNETTVTLSSSDYRVDAYAQPPAIRPNYADSWPAHLADYNAVAVEFSVGYGTTADEVPQRIKNALLMLTTHLYEQRSAVLVGQGVVSKHIEVGVAALLDSARWGGYA